jgi:hypothetical protein
MVIMLNLVPFYTVPRTIKSGVENLAIAVLIINFNYRLECFLDE